MRGQSTPETNTVQAFQPAGFEQRTLTTPLGQMVYTAPAPALWPDRDRDPLVFLHSLGGGSSAYEWSKVFPVFAATHRAIAPDLIGWGDSAHPMRTYKPQDYLDQIQWLLDSITTEPVWIVASSLTAALTLRLATEQPQRFKGLFLVSPSGYRDFGSGYNQELPAQLLGLPGVDRLVYTLGAGNELAVRNFLEQFLFAQPSRLSPEIVAAYLASATQPNAEYAALASLKGDICFDLAAYVPKLAVPTVWVWGEESRFSSLEQGKRLAALNPKAVRAFHTISKAGVLPHLEVPAIVTSLLLQAIAI